MTSASRVRVAGSDVAFACAGDETILDAAERAGYLLPSSCRRGACRTCEGVLVAGDLAVGSRRISARSCGVLLCQARPCSDVEIATKRIERRPPPQRKALTARVYRIARAARGATILSLRFPIGMRAPFLAGQHLQVLLEDGTRRNYSMANPAHESDGVELHVRHVPGGRFSDATLARLREGDPLPLELPFGQFFLRNGDAPAILLATGTGFAPIKSIIESALRRGSLRPMRLYWGGRSRDDLYMLERAAQWAARAPWLSFVPVLSRPPSDWRGRTGFVHRAALEDNPDMSAMEVYACGNPRMITAALRELASEAGLPAARFYADAFVAATSDAPARGDQRGA